MQDVTTSRFANRAAAGQALAARLGRLDPADTVVLALPRGGVPVGYEIAKANGVALDLVLVRKIGTPGQPELALGAVVDGAVPTVVINDALALSLGYSEEAVRALADRELAEIDRRRARYLPDRAPPAIAGKTVIVVDDGVATGATARAALKALKQAGAARVVLAVPVAPAGVVEAMAEDADEVVCLSEPRPFLAVGSAYADFGQVGDDEVVALLAAARRP